MNRSLTFRWVPIVALTAALSGCAASAVLAGAGAGSAIAYDQRSLRTMYEDQQTSHQAYGMLRGDQTLEGTHLNVTVFNHNVLLTGEVSTPAQRARAFRLVRSLPMVKKVYNQVTIEGNPTSVARYNDSWITGKVRTALLREHGLNSAQIKVTTEASVVYLLGITTPSQARLAVQAARHVAGVKRVVTLFQYAH